MARFNRVRVLVGTGGSGDLVLGSADAGLTPVAGYTSMSGIPYTITWGTSSYECGYGSLASDGVTFARSHIVENDAGTTDAQTIPAGAKLSIGVLAANYVAYNGDYNAPPVASGYGSIAIGTGAVVTGGFSTAIGTNASVSGNNSMAVGNGASAAGVGAMSVGPGSVADGDSSIAVGGYADSTAPSSISIGSETTTPHEIRIGLFPEEFRRIHFRCTTTNATPTGAADKDYPTATITIPDGETWSIKTRVMGVAYDTGTLVETKAKVRTFTLIGGPTGVLVAGTPVDELNHNTFSGTASVAISAAGVLSVTVTGIASTTIDWSIQHEIQRLYHGV